jgi:Asp-tRNA(Asn)/Glu-tRNA(Gln) amidotransferase C subunit
MDFLFHKVSEKEKQEISEQAKQILNDFSKELSKIDKKINETFIERDEFEREEIGKNSSDIDRKMMFENAPQKNNDFVIAEKGGWE